MPNFKIVGRMIWMMPGFSSSNTFLSENEWGRKDTALPPLNPSTQVEIDGSRYALPRHHPTKKRQCVNCERCTWNPGPDCGKDEHPHCDHCRHCMGRHHNDDLRIDQIKETIDYHSRRD